MEWLKEKLSKENIIKIIFVFSALAFALPSIRYLIENKTTFKFGPYFKFFLNDYYGRLDQTLIYLCILLALTVAYFGILKLHKKMFKNTKSIFIFIIIISLIFVIVLPFMCSDVFYYLGVGRLASKYSQNPYYVTIKQFVEQSNNIEYLKNDTVLAQGYMNDWADSTVVYGPIWTLICQIVAGMSFGNIDIGLLLFKLINVLIHILNCYIIYKITNKKFFVLLYGINPFVLIEGISSVHNDIFVVCFILSSLYFLLKKKNLVNSVICLALATAIKYFSILLLPFIVIYYFRKEKPSKRFIKCILYGLLFLGIVALTYVMYIRDYQVLSGLATQQGKIAKNFYVIIIEYFTEPVGLVNIVNKLLLSGFVIIYFFTCIIMLNKRKITFREQMQKYNYFLMAFIFLLITNFQPWYIMWLFPILMWQKKDIMKLIVQISLISEFSNGVFLTYGEGWKNGTPYTFIMVTSVLIAIVINNKANEKRKLKTKNNIREK